MGTNIIEQDKNKYKRASHKATHAQYITTC